MLMMVITMRIIITTATRRDAPFGKPRDALVMPFLKLLLVILVVTIDYKLPPTQRISESDKLDKN